jgi:hypothetical protein
MERTLDDRIRERAYYLTINSGGAGDETHFWLIAEREILAEQATDVEAAPIAHAEIPAEPAQSIAVSRPVPAAPAKKAARKSPTSAKAKAPAKAAKVAAPTPAPALKSANVTPLKPVAKTPLKLVASSGKARARAAAR